MIPLSELQCQIFDILNIFRTNHKLSLPLLQILYHSQNKIALSASADYKDKLLKIM